jgi:hypothetical protein
MPRCRGPHYYERTHRIEACGLLWIAALSDADIDGIALSFSRPILEHELEDKSGTANAIKTGIANSEEKPQEGVNVSPLQAIILAGENQCTNLKKPISLLVSVAATEAQLESKSESQAAEPTMRSLPDSVSVLEL